LLGYAWQSIIDKIISNLELYEYNIVSISFITSEEDLSRKLQKDIDLGIRNKDIILRSISRLSLYKNLNTIKINIEDKSIEEIMDLILNC